MNRAGIIGAVVLAVALVLFLFRTNIDETSAEIPAPTTSPSVVQNESDPLVVDEGITADVYEPEAEIDEPRCPIYDSLNREVRAAEYKQKLRHAAGVLSGSGDPEHLIAAAMINASDDPAVAMELLLESIEKNSTLSIASWMAMTLCGQRDVPECETGEVEETAIRVDASNAAMWLQVAGLRLEQGRDREALDAMTKASAMPRFENYFIEQVLLVDRGLATATDWTRQERFDAGSVLMSVTPRDFYLIERLCKKSEFGDAADICTRLGERISTDAKDISTQQLGISLLQAVEEDSEKLETLKHESEQLAREEFSFATDGEVLNVLLNDNDVTQRYLDTYAVYGEAAAVREARSEAARLQSVPGYDKCNFKSNPFVEF